MSRPLHPKATALTYLLTGVFDPESAEGVAQHVADVMGEATDEQKADLYAMLAEQYKPLEPFTKRLKLVSDLLWLNGTPTSLLFNG